MRTSFICALLAAVATPVQIDYDYAKDYAFKLPQQ
jgi:hypothetical protein